MPNKRIHIIDIRQIIRLGGDNCSKRKISMLTGVARKTVSKYLALAESAGIEYSDIVDISDSDLMEILTHQK